MAFGDPANGMFSPTNAASGVQESRGTSPIRLQGIPDAANIGSAASTPFKSSVGSIDYKADETWGTVFKGMAKLGDNAITAADTVIKLDLDDSLRTGVRNLQGQQITEAMNSKEELLDTASNPDTSPRNAPIGLQSSLSRMQTLAKARRQGALSDSNYYAQLGEVVSGVKSKYPGYTSEIDSKIKEITGVDPANALRKSMQDDLDFIQNQSSSKKNAYDSFISSKGKYLPGDWQSRSFTDLQAHVVKMESIEKEMELTKANLSLQKEQGQDVQSRATNELRRVMTNQVATSYSAMITPIMDKLDRIADATPEEAKAMLFTLSQLKLQTKQGLLATANSPLNPNDPSVTWASTVTKGGQDQSRLNDSISQALAPIEALEEAITNKDTGAIKRNAALITQMQDKTTYDIHAKNDTLRKYKTVTDALGPQLAATVLGDRESGLLGPVISAAKTAIGTDAIHGSITQAEPMSIQIAKIKAGAGGKPEDGGYGPQDWNKYIKDKIDVLASPNPGVKPEARENVAKSMFQDTDSTAFLRNLGAGERMTGFTKLTNENTAKAISQMSPEVQKAYTNWSKTNFELAFRTTGDTLRDNVTSSPYFNLKLDPTSNTIKIEMTPEGVRRSGGNPEWLKLNGFLTSETTEKVDKLNEGINAMKGVYKLSGEDPKQAIPQVIANLGLTEKDLGKSGFWYNFYSKMDKGVNLIEDTVRKGLSRPQINPSNTDLPSTIIKGEAAGSYNAIFGKEASNVTGMSVNELLSMQDKNVKDGQPSSAAGGYQFLRGTLRSLKKDLNLSGDEIMTPDFQDKLALQLMKRRGLDAYKSGQITKGQFINNLSKEWASLSGTSGKGAYDGDGLNKARVPLSLISTAIDNLGS